jgi:hypothetical protein
LNRTGYGTLQAQSPPNLVKGEIGLPRPSFDLLPKTGRRVSLDEIENNLVVALATHAIGLEGMKSGRSNWDTGVPRSRRHIADIIISLITLTTLENDESTQ